MAGHGHALRVHYGDVAFVLNVDIDMALAVGDRLLGCASQVDGARDSPVLGIYHGGIGSAMAQDIDAIVKRVEEDAVGPAFYVDRLDERQGLGVPHGDGFAGAESVMRFGVDCGAVSADVGDLANRLEGVQIEYGHAAGIAGARNIQAAAVGIGVDVVEAALASDFHGLEYSVRALLRCANRRQRREAGCRGRKLNSHVFLQG